MTEQAPKLLKEIELFSELADQDLEELVRFDDGSIEPGMRESAVSDIPRIEVLLLLA